MNKLLSALKINLLSSNPTIDHFVGFAYKGLTIKSSEVKISMMKLFVKIVTAILSKKLLHKCLN